jgi:hypothetical protein
MLSTRGIFACRLRISGIAVLALAMCRSAPCTESTVSVAEPQTFALETYAGRTYNYLNTMVDKDDLPYFNIFWSEPAEAAHDWPDFGDVMSRQLQGAIMARHMTGKEARTERPWLKKVLSYLDPQTGLLMRPQTSFSKHEADAGDQALTLYALTTAYSDTKDPALRAAICKMVERFPAACGGFAVKSLMVCAREAKCPQAKKLAENVIRSTFTATANSLFSPDNTFRHGGHMHGNLRTLVGAADYALDARDPVLFSRVDALYRYVRSEGTRFGFLPEVIGRCGDIVSCETCALMDFLGLATTLANNGHPEYWGDVERMVRNQLVESQMTDGSWMKPGTKADTYQFTWRNVGTRMVGGYAGWTSPTHILAARESLQWGGPELRGKSRAFQNCCGGSGTHAFFIAWKNAARFENNVLSVNLHFDKLLPQAEIRGYQPYQGLVTIRLAKACTVRIRIPEFVGPKEMNAKINQKAVQGTVWGNYLELGSHPGGALLEVSYPLPVREEEVAIGNPGFRHYRYRVTWKGDTVVRMAPLGKPPATGYSDFDKQQVAVYYGDDGPGPLYQREAMLTPADPKPAPLHLDDGSLDYWLLH